MRKLAVLVVSSFLLVGCVDEVTDEGFLDRRDWDEELADESEFAEEGGLGDEPTLLASTLEEMIICKAKTLWYPNGVGFDDCARAFKSFNPKNYRFKFHEYDVTFPVDGTNRLRWSSGGASGYLPLKLVKGENLYKVTNKNEFYSCLVADAKFSNSVTNRVRVYVRYMIDRRLTDKIICVDGSGCYSTLYRSSVLYRPGCKL